MIDTMRVEVEVEIWNNETKATDPGYQTFEDVETVEVDVQGALMLLNDQNEFLAAYSPNCWVAVYRVPDEV